MKKRYRRIRPIFVYPIMILGVISFEFGMIAHGSTMGMMHELLGMLIIFLSIYMGAVRFEVKQ